MGTLFDNKNCLWHKWLDKKVCNKAEKFGGTSYCTTDL